MTPTFAPDEIAERFGTGIETLFKVAGPFEAMGHGYRGVLLRNADDSIHCHECGKWFKMLGPHTIRKHGLDSDAYRKKYGLPLTFPLCLRALSARHSELASSKKHIEMLRRLSRSLASASLPWQKGAVLTGR